MIELGPQVIEEQKRRGRSRLGDDPPFSEAERYREGSSLTTTRYDPRRASVTQKRQVIGVRSNGRTFPPPIGRQRPLECFE